MEAAAAAVILLGDLEDPALGLVQQLRRLAVLGVVGDVGDVGAGRDELAQHGVVAHDPRVGLDVGRAEASP